jgi:hypothetical protein
LVEELAVGDAVASNTLSLSSGCWLDHDERLTNRSLIGLVLRFLFIEMVLTVRGGVCALLLYLLINKT